MVRAVKNDVALAQTKWSATTPLENALQVVGLVSLVNCVMRPALSVRTVQTAQRSVEIVRTTLPVILRREFVQLGVSQILICQHANALGTPMVKTVIKTVAIVQMICVMMTMANALMGANSATNPQCVSKTVQRDFGDQIVLLNVAIVEVEPRVIKMMANVQ